MEELEHLKREMDERGSSMTDGSKFQIHLDVIYIFLLHFMS